jgi:molybdopterin converting factor small subunit
VQIDAKNVRELCKELIDMFHLEKSLLLDDSDKLTGNIVLLVNRRNAHILEGADTEINEETEVLIMQFLVGG